MKRLWWLTVAVSLVVAGCGPKGGAPEAKADEHAGEESGHVEGEVKLDAEQQALAGIKTEPVARQLIQASLDVPGTVHSTSKGRAVVTPPVAGRLINLTVQIGQEVRQGQVLGMIESTELAQAAAAIADAQRARDAAASMVQEAKAQIQLAQAKLTSARANLNRQRQFAAAGAFNQAALQAAQGELNDAQSELLSAQKEQAGHAEVVRRLEVLYKDGIVSRAELEAARLELQQDEIRLSRARSRVELSKAAYERERNLVQRGLANSREVQTAESEVRTSQLERDRAEVSAQAAEAALANANRAIGNAQATYRTFAGGGQGNGGRTTLVAPIAGTITHLEVTRGQAVERTQTLFEIENLSSVWVTASVPEKDSTKVRKGAPVRITVAALPNEEFQGIVQVVGGRVDPHTRAVPMECLVTGAGGRLKPDMFATVHLAYGMATETLAVPRSAIVQDGDKAYVFVKDEHGFAKRLVTLGARAGAVIAVLSGLKAGEIVVTQGGFILASEEKKGDLKGHDH